MRAIVEGAGAICIRHSKEPLSQEVCRNVVEAEKGPQTGVVREIKRREAAACISRRAAACTSTNEEGAKKEKLEFEGTGL